MKIVTKIEEELKKVQIKSIISLLSNIKKTSILLSFAHYKFTISKHSMKNGEGEEVEPDYKIVWTIDNKSTRQ